MKKDLSKTLDLWSNYISGNIFYAPILGPVFAQKNKRKLLFEILKNAESKKFLFYDKNKKWFEEKQEIILLDLTSQINKGLIFFTEDNFFQKINSYFYSPFPLDKTTFDKIKNIAKSNSKVFKYKNIFLRSFREPKYKKYNTVHNVYLKKFTNKDRANTVFEDMNFFGVLKNSEKKSFAKFAEEKESSGFDFLWHKYLKKYKSPGPVICAVKNNKVIGAIGPLIISEDFAKNKFLHPPFFAVSEKYKRQGIGKKLWQAAADYARAKNAKYTLVQNVPNSSASKFYEKQGLKLVQQIFTFKVSLE